MNYSLLYSSFQLNRRYLVGVILIVFLLLPMKNYTNIVKMLQYYIQELDFLIICNFHEKRDYLPYLTVFCHFTCWLFISPNAPPSPLSLCTALQRQTPYRVIHRIALLARHHEPCKTDHRQKHPYF